MKVRIVGPGDVVLAEMPHPIILPRKGEVVVIEQIRYRIVEVEWEVSGRRYNRSCTLWAEAI